MKQACTAFLAGLMVGIGLGAISVNSISQSVLREYQELVQKLAEFRSYLESLKGRGVLSVKELKEAVTRIFDSKPDA